MANGAASRQPLTRVSAPERQASTTSSRTAAAEPPTSWRSGAPATLSLARYQSDFNPPDLFDAGPAGYDAVFSLEPGAGLPQRVFTKPVEVQITGSALIYDLADPAGGKGELVKSLSSQYPDLRRFIREGYVRYAFTRFGAAYVVSIQCLYSLAKPRRLACKEAYPIAERFLRALHVAGGQRMRPLMDIVSPPLTTVRIEHREMGRIAARMLVDTTRSGSSEIRHVVLSPQLVVRGSTAFRATEAGA